MGRQNGLLASVSAGKIILTFIQAFFLLRRCVALKSNASKRLVL